MAQKNSAFSETSYNSDSCSDYGPIINEKNKKEQNEEVINLSINSKSTSGSEYDIENSNYNVNESNKKEDSQYDQSYSFSFKVDSNAPVITGKAKIGQNHSKSTESQHNEEVPKNSKCCFLL